MTFSMVLDFAEFLIGPAVIILAMLLLTLKDEAEDWGRNQSANR